MPWISNNIIYHFNRDVLFGRCIQRQGKSVRERIIYEETCRCNHRGKPSRVATITWPAKWWWY